MSGGKYFRESNKMTGNDKSLTICVVSIVIGMLILAFGGESDLMESWLQR